MTDKPPYNEPAFPVLSPTGEQFLGMTLRDYFAAAAMAALLADLYDAQAAEIKQLRKHLEFNVDANEKHWAEIERLRETISAKDVEIERLRGDTP